MFSIDHLGIAVKSLAGSKKFYERLGLDISPEEIVEGEQVRLVMVPVGESRLELLEATSEDSAIARFIAKHGEGLHHVCLKVPDLIAIVDRLKKDGVRLVSNEIKVGAGGHRYVFVHPSSAGGVLVELVEGHQSMLLVAADTSGKHGSIALAQGEADGSCSVIETVSLEGNAFSAQLVPQISALLSKHQFDKKEIGGFVAVSGPGSFTGLRVGLAAIKALAEVLAKPIAAISLLEAVAAASEFQGDILAALDAGRQQVYVGEYKFSPAGTVRLSERSMTRDEFLNLVSGSNVVTPDSRIAEVSRNAGVAVQVIEIPQADVIARLGWKKILAGETVLPGELEANYMSRPDGEMFSRRF